MKKRGFWEMLGFDEPDDRFELLETESGTPPWFSEDEISSGASKPAAGRSRGIPRATDKAEKLLREDFTARCNPDLIIRRFKAGGRYKAMAALINGMADGDQVSDFILREAMKKGCMDGCGPDKLGFLMDNVLTMSEAELVSDWDEMVSSMLDGKTALIVEGCGGAVIMDTRGYEHRSVGTTENEKTVKGPREGFTENLRTNITLIRRQVRTADLICDIRPCGGANGTKLCLAYREGIANDKLVELVRKKLDEVSTRALLDVGVIEQLIEDDTISPLPKTLSTERPDRAAWFLMQGHVVILLDGSPFADILPVTLFSLMSSPEDTYLRRAQGSVIRIVRYAGALISLILPAYFLSLCLFHQGILSTEMLSTIIASRRMVFAPLATELLFLLLVFQLIREAGLRVPGSIGQAIGIIGGLILGQAAVTANLASSMVLIIVALTGLGNFCIPDYATQLSAAYIRLLLVASAWLAGLLGMTCTLIIMAAHMLGQKSFGIPFLAPFAPKAMSDRPMILRGRIRNNPGASDKSNTEVS